MCYHVGVHKRYGHKPLAEYLRRRKENKPPGSVDHVQTHVMGDWGILGYLGLNRTVNAHTQIILNIKE
jgi:hypothetical protein